MVTVSADIDPSDRYAGAPSLPDHPVLREIERDVIGAVYRANGYTTAVQADDLCGRLGLGPGHRLLDLGAGCGWPGLYIAERTGCEVVMTDPVADCLPVAVARAGADGTSRRAAAVGAAGDELPFRARTFDAVVHTDVLC